MAEYLELNLYYSLLEMVRRPILEGELPALSLTLTAVAFTAAIGLITFLLQRKVERTLSA